jgi:hypothetical protein
VFSKRQKPEAEGLRASRFSWKVVLVDGIHGNFFPVFSHPLVFHDAVNESKQGVILAATHVVTGVDLGSVLPEEDITGSYLLITELLAAKSLT